MATEFQTPPTFGVVEDESNAVAADDVMQGLSGASKLNADWDFLVHLRDIGRERSQVWIENHFDDLGVESTIDVRSTYL